MEQNRDRPFVDIESLVESHTNPFMVIDKRYRIVAINSVFARAFGVSKQEVIGRACYEVSHCNDVPCHVLGHKCPHQKVFSTGKPYSCTHEHYDNNHRLHKCKVDAAPLIVSNGEIYVGECIEEVPLFTGKYRENRRMVGQSSAFRACLEKLDMAAGSDAPVLLEGETGVGKELAAEYIHKNSARADNPFQILDSTVLTDGLFESEVFGHEKGAYTGSHGRKQGLFELAEGGTLFIDEIGDLPASQQSKLLRVLETGQFRRVGGNDILSANVRVICATNQALWDSVQASEFREDLFYRIACMNIRLPPLRERMQDVPLITRTLVECLSGSMRCRLALTEDALEPLLDYDYPGNVRELRNILYIAATHSTNCFIDAQTVQKVMDSMPQCRHDNQQQTASGREPPVADTGQLVRAARAGSLTEVESHYIESLLKQYNGNRKRVAVALGVSERTVYRKLKKLNLN